MNPTSRRSRARADVRVRSVSLGRFVRDNSSLLTFAGLTLGVFLSRKFFVLPLAVAFTLAQETAQERFGVPRRPRRRA
jgi:hypothetical protein